MGILDYDYLQYSPPSTAMVQKITSQHCLFSMRCFGSMCGDVVRAFCNYRYLTAPRLSAVVVDDVQSYVGGYRDICWHFRVLLFVVFIICKELPDDCTS